MIPFISKKGKSVRFEGRPQLFCRFGQRGIQPGGLVGRTQPGLQIMLMITQNSCKDSADIPAGGDGIWLDTDEKSEYV